MLVECEGAVGDVVRPTEDVWDHMQELCCLVRYEHVYMMSCCPSQP